LWPYLPLTPNLRDVEELLAERGLDISHESALVIRTLQSGNG
jgi:hypothetical protein